MDIANAKHCGNCKYWENSVKSHTVLEQYGSVGMCKIKATLMNYASKCIEWSPKNQIWTKGESNE